MALQGRGHRRLEAPEMSESSINTGTDQAAFSHSTSGKPPALPEVADLTRISTGWRFKLIEPKK